MLIVEGIFDGRRIKALKEIPFETKRKEIITFLDDFVYDTDSEYPIKALRGYSKNSNLSWKLLESRREDSDIEDSNR